jgi:hypothetical protein
MDPVGARRGVLPPGAREEGHRLDRAAAVREARASGARRRWRGAPQEPSKLGVFASIVYEFAVISRFIAEQKLKQLQEERFRRLSSTVSAWFNVRRRGQHTYEHEWVRLPSRTPQRLQHLGSA